MKLNVTVPIPHIFFDQYLKKLRRSDLKVMLAIYRLTHGKGKDGNWLSKGELQDLTGLRLRTIGNAIKRLSQLALIQAQEEKVLKRSYAVSVEKETQESSERPASRAFVKNIQKELEEMDVLPTEE